jgi:hypothetical protein
MTTINNTGLVKATGIAAAVAGALFIAVQIKHPGFDTYLAQTNDWVMRCSAKAVMTVLALAGITGMYLRQVRQMRLLGLIGYIVFALGYLMMFVTEVVAVVFLPALTDKAPAFVNDVVVASGGGTAIGDIGQIHSFFDLMGACYLLGGLVFGIALFRSGVLARWAAVLLAVSTFGTAALAFLPSSFDRPMAVPEGVALIGLGISLWRSGRTADTQTVVAPVSAEAVSVR